VANILIIEDDKSMEDLYRSALHDHDAHHKVTLACNGEDGISEALRECPDLVILDLMLPGMSGVEVAYKLEDLGIFPSTPLIIATAVPDEEAQDIAELCNATALLIKPFKISLMRDAIQRALPHSGVSDERGSRPPESNEWPDR